MSASSLNSAAGGECAAGSRGREGRDRRPGAGPRPSGRFPPGGSRRPVSGTDTRVPPRRSPCPARGTPQSRARGRGPGPYRSPGGAAHQVGPRPAPHRRRSCAEPMAAAVSTTSPEQPAVTVSAPTRYSTPRQRPSAIPSWHAHLAAPGGCRDSVGFQGLDHTGRSRDEAAKPLAHLAPETIAEAVSALADAGALLVEDGPAAARDQDIARHGAAGSLDFRGFRVLGRGRDGAGSMAAAFESLHGARYQSTSLTPCCAHARSSAASHGFPATVDGVTPVNAMTSRCRWDWST
ncbi:hypothetical protein OEIGOIKO_00533 [Streptomyces chrestomyceticus JCM 4735]|uniref:Uncharacterized protein n=1 Tax=Streptomyces chrestomyceticus JCM 4735 TaxID=1306181 RepID=A0A7U9PVY9_9ACTN|nr:hypothetical protein OEIGOIKO_00533 [Streptomyces chrestomyceticus JCM 4735]